MAWLLEVAQYIAVQEKGSKQHPLILFPLIFIFCFSFSCMLSTDMSGDRSATIIWACLSFFLTMSIYIVRFLNKDGVELSQIGEDKTGSCTYHTVFIKDTNSVAVSSGEGINICITMIDIESMEVMTTISMDAENRRHTRSHHCLQRCHVDVVEHVHL
jgi:hypothetical protein